MADKALFDHARFSRVYALAVTQKVSEERADVVPPGFRNNIRWNLGHMLVGFESIVSEALGIETEAPEGYLKLFEGGTSPADWAGAGAPVPGLPELRKLLDEQSARLSGLLAGHLEEKLAKPFAVGPYVEYRTVGEVLDFAIYHEAVHLGFIKGLLAATWA